MRVGIIGTGLIGGSLALALKASGRHKVYCWNRRAEVSKKAVKLNAVDKYFDSVEQLAENSEVIIIATPLGSYSAICKKLLKYLDGKRIISDVGSVKFAPVQQALKTIPEKYKSFFVPAHPIAGKEKGGIEHASANLYKGKKLIICKTANCKKGKKIAELWRDAGVEIEFLNAKKHDEIYAYVSHYVQYISHSISKIFPKGGGEFSRLMNSPEDMWVEIFKFNSENLKKVHKEFLSSFLRKLKYVSSYSGKNEFDVAAKIIASSYIDIIPLKYTEYAGSGYKSFTSVVTNAKQSGKKISPEKVSKILSKVYNELKKAKF